MTTRMPRIGDVVLYWDRWRNEYFPAIVTSVTGVGMVPMVSVTAFVTGIAPTQDVGIPWLHKDLVSFETNCETWCCERREVGHLLPQVRKMGKSPEVAPEDDPDLTAADLSVDDDGIDEALAGA